MRQQHDFSIGKLKGVMMDVRAALVDLLELCHRVAKSPGEDDAVLASHLVFKRKLRAGKQTDSHIRFVTDAKPRVTE